MKGEACAIANPGMPIKIVTNNGSKASGRLKRGWCTAEFLFRVDVGVPR
jgi:hypothetical protein